MSIQFILVTIVHITETVGLELSMSFHNIYLSKLCNYVLQFGFTFVEEMGAYTLNATQSRRLDFNMFFINFQLLSYYLFPESLLIYEGSI